MKKKLPFSISEIAIRKIKEVMASKQIEGNYCLRLGVKSAGCGIASYIIGFDHANEKDELFEESGITIVIEKMQLMYLAGKSVDYGQAEGQTGFIFRDSN